MYQAITGFTVTPTGLTLHRQYPYLGATSDGLVSDCIVVEFKCPFNGRDRSAAGYQHIASVDGKLALKKTPPYYCQVRGEMAIKKVGLCRFVVWTTVDTALNELVSLTDMSQIDTLSSVRIVGIKNIAENVETATDNSASVAVPLPASSSLRITSSWPEKFYPGQLSLAIPSLVDTVCTVKDYLSQFQFMNEHLQRFNCNSHLLSNVQCLQTCNKIRLLLYTVSCLTFFTVIQ